jgi:hypothetical protein
MTMVLAKIIDNNLTTDDWTVFLIVVSAILLGLAVYHAS